ncbi:MAG TPA: polymer-forming cytoskeletal protein [Acidobacteriota bacterium]|jgi:cytoskeletal protein CcmA (bactofilin family)|nr:polymer-forming cytoskeletal protein [Acidobacteriota bacterium]
MEVKTQSPPKSGPRPLDSTVEPCTLGREVNFKGTLETTEDLTILGRVDGKIKAKGALVIGKEANATATVEGQRILVLGRVKGTFAALSGSSSARPRRSMVMLPHR